MTMLQRSELDSALESAEASFPEAVRRRGVYRHSAENRFRLHQLAAFVRPGDRLLDLGAGSGVVPLALARLGVHVVALDNWREYAPELNNQMGAADDQLARLRASGVDAVVHDLLAADRLPFDDASFDVVTFYDVIEHLPRSPRPVLEEMRRVLRPGGRAVVTTPNLANLRARVRLLLGRTNHFPIDEWYDADPFFGHIREYTPDELRHMMRRAGFDTLELKLSNGLQVNTRRSDGTWARGLRPTSAFQIAKLAYLGVTWLVPRWRFEMHCVGTRP